MLYQRSSPDTLHGEAIASSEDARTFSRIIILLLSFSAFIEILIRTCTDLQYEVV